MVEVFFRAEQVAGRFCVRLVRQEGQLSRRRLMQVDQNAVVHHSHLIAVAHLLLPDKVEAERPRLKVQVAAPGRLQQRSDDRAARGHEVFQRFPFRQEDVAVEKLTRQVVAAQTQTQSVQRITSSVHRSNSCSASGTRQQ